MSNDKKKKNDLSWSKIYTNFNHNKFSYITNVYHEIQVRSDPKYLFRLNNYPLFVLIIIIIGLLIFTFKSSPKALIYCTIFLLSSLLLCCFYGLYNLRLTDKNLVLNIRLQRIIIDYKDLKNIYIDRAKSNILFFIPIYIYSLNIIYMDNSEPYQMAIPLIMANKNDIVKLFKTIKFDAVADSDDIERKNEKEKKHIISIFLKLLGIGIFVALIISYIFYTKNISAN